MDRKNKEKNKSSGLKKTAIEYAKPKIERIKPGTDNIALGQCFASPGVCPPVGDVCT